MYNPVSSQRVMTHTEKCSRPSEKHENNSTQNERHVGHRVVICESDSFHSDSSGFVVSAITLQAKYFHEFTGNEEHSKFRQKHIDV